jgi:hypothetical protein
MAYSQIVLALAGRSPVLVLVIAGFYVLSRLPRLIAAFRVAITTDEGKAKRAREALEALERRPLWIWQKRS